VKEDNKIKVMVENYGETIPEDKLDKIWDRFYRLDESRDRKTGGTGLGLSIVKNILQLHQSQYGVRNTEKGVLFYFYLEAAVE
jgi:signal transduction histidine kinase